MLRSATLHYAQHFEDPGAQNPGTPPFEAGASRQPSGSTDDSDADTTTRQVPEFERSTQWLRESQEAAADPDRPRIPFTQFSTL